MAERLEWHRAESWVCAFGSPWRPWDRCVIGIVIALMMMMAMVMMAMMMFEMIFKML